MLHAIIPFKSYDAILFQLEDKAIRYHFYEGEDARIFFVSFDGTTRELADAVGLTKGGNGSGVVLAFDNYAGFANPDIWEWIRKYDYE